jgi:hypothetical protein
MREPLGRVREGMPVYDRENARIGTVRTVYLGSEPGSVTADQPAVSPHSFVDDLAQALAPAALPDAIRARLLREGFIRIDTSGIFAADRYALATEIRSVSEAGVMLDATRDELVRRS